MGKHNRVEPKKVSFLGSMAGIFAAMALAGGLLAIGQVTGNPFDNNAKPPVPIEIPTPGQPPKNMVATGTALTNLPEAQPGPATPPGSVTGAPTVIVPVPVPQEPTKPPTLSPSPNPSPSRPDVDVEARVDTPIVGVDTDLELRVPLLGSAVDTVGEVVEDVTDPLTDLLGK